MRIVFFGSGEFGLPTLKKIFESRHEVAAVVTQPDKKKGRGWNVQAAPFKAYMEGSWPGIMVLQPEKLSDPGLLPDLARLGADVFVVIDYGQFLTKEVLAIPKKYCVNLHPSLLPKYRGAAPVNRALMAGEKITGNTVIKMDERMDAGEIILQEETAVRDDEDAVSLSARLADSGAVLLIKTLDLIEKGGEKLVLQDDKAVTFARKLSKEEGLIDWTKDPEDILRKIRGAQPWPGAFTYLGGKMIKIFKARRTEYIFHDSPAGAVVDPKRLIVCAGDGFIQIDELQVEGKRAMSVPEFLRGSRIEKGKILG